MRSMMRITRPAHIARADDRRPLRLIRSVEAVAPEGGCRPATRRNGVLERHYCGPMARARSSTSARLLAGLAVAGFTLVVTSCGDGGDVTAGPSYTIVSGDTLDGIARRAGVPLDDLIAVNGWSDGAGHTILPGDVIVLPDGATVPTPRVTTTAAASSGSGSSTSGSGSGRAEGGYTQTSTRYSEADSLTITSPLADGEYGAEATSDGTTITFVLFRYISSATCAEGLSEEEASTACASPPLTEPGDGTSLTVAGSDLDEATVFNGFDLNDTWSVDGMELARLLAGEAPAADAPAGFEFMGAFAYRIIVEDGAVVEAHQQFHS